MIRERSLLKALTLWQSKYASNLPKYPKKIIRESKDFRGHTRKYTANDWNENLTAINSALESGGLWGEFITKDMSRTGSIGKVVGITNSREVLMKFGKDRKPVKLKHSLFDFMIIDPDEESPEYVFKFKKNKKEEAPAPITKWGQELGKGILVAAATKREGLQIGRISKWTHANVWIKTENLSGCVSGNEIMIDVFRINDQVNANAVILPETYEEILFWGRLGGPMPDPNDYEWSTRVEST